MIVGVLFFVVGVAMFYWPEQSQKIIKSIYAGRQSLYLLGFFEAFGGLAIFVNAALWDKIWLGPAVKLFGWYLAIEGLCYLFLPMKWLEMIPSMTENRKVSIAISLFYIFISLILIYALLLVRKM
jgi:uncharacterized protein YjeT (DUF2065 family)